MSGTTMITIHCLAFSRAIRLVWLMEDLKQPYDLVMYDRTEGFRAPKSLSEVHPLGKSPVIEENGSMLAESATCLRYLADRFDDDVHRPAAGTPERLRHEELLDYVESTFAPAAMKLLLPALQGKEPSDEARDAIRVHYDYVTGQLGDDGLLFGDTPTLADIQFSYLLANLSRTGQLDAAPRLVTWWQALQREPGYKSAVSKAGPMAPDV